MYTLLLTFCFQDWKRNIDQKRRWAITSCFSTVTVLYCAIDGHSGAFYIKGKIRSLPQETYSLAVGTLEVTVRGQEPMYQSQEQNWVEVVGAANVTLRYIAYGVFRAESFAPIPLLFVLMRWLARWCQGFQLLGSTLPSSPLIQLSLCM